MNGLLYHYWMLNRWYFAAMMALLIVLCTLNILFDQTTSLLSIIFFPLVISALAPFINLDKRTVMWINSLPISKREQVKAQFVFILVFIGIQFVFIAPAYFWLTTEPFTMGLSIYCAFVTAVLLSITVYLFLHYVYPDLGHIVIIFTVIVTVIVGVAAYIPMTVIFSEVIPFHLHVFVIPIACLIFYWFVYETSVDWYESREVAL